MMSRFVRGLRSFDRMGETLRCVGATRQWRGVTAAYLGVSRLDYPFTLTLRSGRSIVLEDWNDLTTAWVNFFGDEYTIRPTDRLIVDLGANIGAFSLHASLACPEARIVAVEPFPATFRRLEATMRGNGLDGRVSCRNWAITGHDGPAFMDDRPEIPSHSRQVGAVARAAALEVEGVSLATLLEREGIDEIDLLKMDIEGGEYSLIADTEPGVLRRCRRIALEYHETGDPARLWEKLESSGFRHFRRSHRAASGVAEYERH